MSAGKLRRRLTELRKLETRVRYEITATEAELDELMVAARERSRRRRSRFVRPECGTEEGYQWHRYHDRGNWPLPVGDPCGCRAAHAKRDRVRRAVQAVAS